MSTQNAPGAGRQDPELIADLVRVTEALQDAWNEFCDDTGNFPDCFEWRGRKLYADFHRGNFARMVAEHLEVRTDG